MFSNVNEMEVAVAAGERSGSLKPFSLSKGEKAVSIAAVMATLLVHLVYFYQNWKLGFPSKGVDGDIYFNSAMDCLKSDTLLLEKCNNLFWTPWYVVIALLKADHFWVFGFNMLMKYVAAGCAAYLGLIMVGRKWLRIIPAIAWLLYWPTFDYVIFFHYEIALAAVCTAVPLLVHILFRKMQESNAGKYKEASSSRSPAHRTSVILGLALGFGIFSHSRLIGLLLAVWFCTFLWMHRGNWRRSFLHLMVITLLAILPTLLWGYRNYRLFDKWVFSSTSVGYNLYVGYNELAEGYFKPQPPYPPLDQARQMAIDYIQRHPGRSAYLFLKRHILFWMPSEMQDFGPRLLLVQEYLLLPLGLLSILALCPWFLKLLQKRWRGQRISPEEMCLVTMLLIVLWFQFFHAIFYVTNPRFRIPVIPLIATITAVITHRVFPRGRNILYENGDQQNRRLK